MSLAGHPRHGTAELHRAETPVGGDAGVHDGDLLGQDGHADDQRDVRRRTGAPGPRGASNRSRGGGSFIQSGGRRAEPGEFQDA